MKRLQEKKITVKIALPSTILYNKYDHILVSNVTYLDQ